jgi:hypothetical protein
MKILAGLSGLTFKCCFSLLIPLAPCWSQSLGTPQPVYPKGGAPQYFPLRWKAVPGADRYKLQEYYPARPACMPDKSEISFTAGQSEAMAEADKVCSGGICEIKPRPLGTGWMTPGVTGAVLTGPHPERARACIGTAHTGPLYTFYWSVQAFRGTTQGPESERIAFWLDAAPAPASPRTPPTPKVTFTCVFRVGNENSAWFEGISTMFVGIDGNPNPEWKGKTVEFSPQPNRNCNNFGVAGTPLGPTNIQIKTISVCRNLVSGYSLTVVNASCPITMDTQNLIK